jgi:PAS domain S-box-containing protein
MDLLIVDDHLINLKLLRAQLESEGHVVFEAHDGVDAFALLERQHVDVVISDILMPRMDGYSLCYEIRKHTRLCDLPIIIYTSTYLSPGDENLALDMGADKYLKKPVSVATIVAALHEIVAQPHAAPRPDELREVETLKNYNERLVSKLKEKNTELQAQTEVLRESELQYRTLADSGQALIWTSGPDKKCDYFNQPWLMFTGRTLEQELGDGWAEGVHPDDLARCFEIYTTAFDRRECFSMDYRLRRHDGEFRWIQDDGSPRYDSQWNFLGYIGHCLDITERKQAEEENKTILRTMIDGFYLVDLEGRILETNDAYCSMIGYSREELRKIGVKGVEAIDTQEVIKQRIQRILETGSDRFETKHIRKDGRVIDVEAAVNRIRNLGRLFVFMRDITARKQAEQILEFNAQEG